MWTVENGNYVNRRSHKKGIGTKIQILEDTDSDGVLILKNYLPISFRSPQVLLPVSEVSMLELLLTYYSFLIMTETTSLTVNLKYS